MKSVLPLAVALLLTSVMGTAASAQAKFKKSYRSDMNAFLDEASKTYPFFDLKGNRKDFDATAKRLRKEVRKIKSDAEFMALVVDGMRSLRDSHLQITECQVNLEPPPPEFYCGLSFLEATDSRVVVLEAPPGKSSDLKPGTQVLEINGEDAREFLDAQGDASWASGGFFSSPQRARFFVYRYGLQGERGEKFKLKCRVGKRTKTINLACQTELKGWTHNYHLPEDLKQVGESLYYARLPSGLGYIYLRRVDSGLAEGLAEALKHLDGVNGFIVDLRGNTGGGYDQDLLSKIESMSAAVAVILDAGCISAGETLARDFVRLKDARIFGSRSAGASSTKRLWAFPSGIATLKFSTGTRRSYDGEVIEFNGVSPHEVVEAEPEELLQGENSQILRAQEFLLKGKD